MSYADDQHWSYTEGLEAFESLQFDRWIAYMSRQTGMTPDEVVSVLYYAAHHGMVSGVEQFGMDLAYTKHTWPFKGRTPVEIAKHFFIRDHWLSWKPIEDREVIWHDENGLVTANLFRETFAFAETIHKLTETHRS